MAIGRCSYGRLTRFLDGRWRVLPITGGPYSGPFLAHLFGGFPMIGGPYFSTVLAIISGTKTLPLGPIRGP